MSSNLHVHSCALALSIRLAGYLSDGVLKLPYPAAYGTVWNGLDFIFPLFYWGFVCNFPRFWPCFMTRNEIHIFRITWWWWKGWKICSKFRNFAFNFNSLIHKRNNIKLIHYSCTSILLHHTVQEKFVLENIILCFDWGVRVKRISTKK